MHTCRLPCDLTQTRMLTLEGGLLTFRWTRNPADSHRSLSDFSDYDSSDEEYRRGHSRQHSRAHSRHHDDFDPYASNRHPDPSGYAALEEEGGKQGLLSADDPFGDPFADDNAARTPQHEKQRMECKSDYQAHRADIQGPRSRSNGTCVH